MKEEYVDADDEMNQPADEAGMDKTSEKTMDMQKIQ